MMYICMKLYDCIVYFLQDDLIYGVQNECSRYVVLFCVECFAFSKHMVLSRDL